MHRKMKIDHLEDNNHGGGEHPLPHHGEIEYHGKLPVQTNDEYMTNL